MRTVAAVLKGLKLPPRFKLRQVKEDPIRLELTLTPAYGKDPILVGLVGVPGPGDLARSGWTHAP